MIEMQAWLFDTRLKIVQACAALSPENVNDIGVLQGQRLLQVLTPAYMQIKGSTSIRIIVLITTNVAYKLPGTVRGTVWEGVFMDQSICQKLASIIQQALMDLQESFG